MGMKIKGGKAVVQSLIEHEVQTVYGLPGSHILEIYDALQDEEQINHILTLHELNAAFMADAHGRLTGKPGVCLITAGPGATNAVTGIAQAYSEASPVVQITGHCDSNRKIWPFHGVDDWNFLMKIYQPITKWSVQIKRIEDISQILSKAFTIATSGRPGPVHVEIPQDILSSSGIIKKVKVPTHIKSPKPTSAIKRVVEILNSANNPLIAVGKGVLREFCSDEVIKFAELAGIPLITLWWAKSAIPYQHPLCLGYDLDWNIHPQIKSFIEKTDIILTIGLDAGERLTNFNEKENKLIHIHQDTTINANEEISLLKPKPLIDIATNLQNFIQLLQKEFKPNPEKMKIVERKVSTIKRKIEKDVNKSIIWGSTPLHPGEISTEIRRVLNDDAIVTLDVANSAIWMNRCFRAQTPNTILTPGRYGSMGFPLPAAIAAKINFPKRQVVAVVGDGAFLMTAMDFHTAIKYNLGIVVIVMNDRQYGVIWQLQNLLYNGRTFATETESPNFAEYARICGGIGIKVRDPKDLRDALEKAINAKSPVIVDIDTEYQFPFYRSI
jgi:acetolactate synthase-1/2/3 large subunit